MRTLFILFSLFIGSIAGTHAAVDLRTGNYYVSYSDLEFPGSKAEIMRSYNSNTSATGLFGYGWGTGLQTKLFALPDGSLILRWWGVGTGDYYEPFEVNKQGLYEMTNAVIANLIKKNKLDNNPVAIAEKKSYFLINHQERAAKYIEMQQEKLVPVYIPKSKNFTWTLDVNQVIYWDGKKFEARSWKDRYEFNSIGQMTSMLYQDYNLQLTYKGKDISGILVDKKFACTIQTDSTGKITRMAFAENGIDKIAIYKYDSLNNLVYSKDAGDNEYWFSYDLFHNLVRIDYEDKTFVEMQYDPANNRCIKFRDKNGSFQTYQYPYFYTSEGKINYQHYATEVKKYDSVAVLSFTQYKEFENRTLDDGTSYLHRIVEKTDTSFHEAIYNAAVGNAWYRTNNNGKAWSQYDSKKRPVYLRINDSIYRGAYNDQDMPIHFVVIDSLKRDSLTYYYKHDINGDLIQVIRNKTTYTISGSRALKSQTIKRGSDQLTIRFKEDEPYSIENKVLGVTILADEPANKTVTQNSPTADRKKLLSLYQEFSDVMEPKRILHEWIWEKL